MKNNIILRLFLTAAAAVLPLAVLGQSLDPTVEVSRTYEGKLMEVHKPQLKMAVPDSVYRFDLEFDYSVTDKPYKGAYEFTPYTVEMKPSPTLRRSNSFYLKAGAGYQLHPELDLIWSPGFNGPFRMNLYASHRSFIGNYWRIYAIPEDGGAVSSIDRADAMESGYELLNKAGIDGRYDWEKGRFRFDIGYYGVEQDGLSEVMRVYNSLYAKAGIASKKLDGFIYRADVSYRFGKDRIWGPTDMPVSYDAEQGTAEFGFDSEFGYVLANGGVVSMDVCFEKDDMSGHRGYHGYDTDIVPHYVADKGRWRFDLGLRISAALSTSRFTDQYGVEGQIVYPDVRIEFMAIADAMKLYLDFGGDSWINSYSDILSLNRFANSYYSRDIWELMDVSEEKINAAAGAEGRIGSKFSYNLKGGYVKYGNALLEGIVASDYGLPGVPETLTPVLGYASYDKMYASLDWLLDAECVRFDGSVEYAYAISGFDADATGLFMPAALTGDVSFAYNWKKRISVGTDCQFSAARNGSLKAYPQHTYGDSVHMSARIPGYADLGVSLEYVVNRKFSVWARGGNLLGMTIQRNLLYAEKGPYFTAGICLNL